MLAVLVETLATMLVLAGQLNRKLAKVCFVVAYCAWAFVGGGGGGE